MWEDEYVAITWIMKDNTEPSLTCSQEEHLIAPISSCNLVHRNRGELIVYVGPDH